MRRTGGLMIGALQGNAIHVVNYDDRQQLDTITPLSPFLASISAISPSGTSAVIDGLFSGFAIVDVRGQELWRSSGDSHFGNVYGLALSHDGNKIALQNRRGVCYFGIYSEKPVWVLDNSTQENLQLPQISKSLSWAPDSMHLVFSTEGEVRVYSLATRRSMAVSAGLDPTWSPDGKWIASRGLNGGVSLIEWHGLKSVKTLKGVKALGPLRWSPDTSYLIYERKDESESYHKYFPSDGLGSQLVVHRVSDSAECVVLDPMYKGMGRDFGWLKIAESLVSPSTR